MGSKFYLTFLENQRFLGIKKFNSCISPFAECTLHIERSPLYFSLSVYLSFLLSCQN